MSDFFDLCEYESNILSRVHNEELSILLKIDELSKKYNFSYWLEYGTLLGAIRHKGFIPWDDDIDIGMTRKDYNKLISISKMELGCYCLIDPGMVESNHIRCFAQCIKKDTVFLTEEYMEFSVDGKKFSPNFCIDIFIYDNCKEENVEKIICDTKKIKRMYMYSRSILTPNRGNFKKRFQAILKRLYHYYLLLLNKKPEEIYSDFLELVTKEQDEEYICNFTTMPEHEIRASFNKRENYETKLVEFENYKFPIPICYNDYLKKLYGDYMELPSINDRHRELPIEIDFGDGKMMRLKGN